MGYIDNMVSAIPIGNLFLLHLRKSKFSVLDDSWGDNSYENDYQHLFHMSSRTLNFDFLKCKRNVSKIRVVRSWMIMFTFCVGIKFSILLKYWFSDLITCLYLSFFLIWWGLRTHTQHPYQGWPNAMWRMPCRSLWSCLGRERLHFVSGQVEDTRPGDFDVELRIILILLLCLADC